MNPISVAIATLIHYNVEVRDTLEYCINKTKYDTRLYDEKKRAILIEIEEKTPLKDILSRSGDNGAKLEKQIREFYEEVYGDSSTILKKADDGLRVDAAQHLAIYKHVIPVHEQVNAIILGLINDAHKNKQDVAQVEALWNADERFYRGLAMMTLTADLIKLFDDFNKAMRENKGQPNPSSNFIQQDITMVIGHINTVRVNARVPQLDYKEGVEDKVTALVENISGRRELKPGLKLPDVFRDVQTSIADYVKSTEGVFRTLYVPAMQALIEQAKVDQAKRESGAIPETPTPTEKVEEKKESFGEGDDIPLSLDGNKA